MTPMKDLQQRLDQATPDEWEAAFADKPLEITRDEAYELVASKLPYSEWLAFRFDAGPPGVALPEFDQAVKNLLSGNRGTPLDAYRVVFSERPWPATMDAEEILALLNNAAVAAMKGGTTWFAMWLAARAGLAAIEVGRPDRAWLLLLASTVDGRRHPHMQKLELFEPLRGKTDLITSVWVRRTIWRLWPALRVPALPSLPYPEAASNYDARIEEVIERLQEAGAKKVADLVRSFRTAMGGPESSPGAN